MKNVRRRLQHTFGFLTLCSVVSVTTVVVAQVNRWTSTSSGKWETGSKWSTGAPPSMAQSAFITNVVVPASDLSKFIAVDATTVLSNGLNGCMTVSNLTIWAPGLFRNNLLLNSAGLTTSLDILNQLMVTNSSVVSITNSILRVLGTFLDDGNVVLQSGSLIVTNSLTIGNEKSGMLTLLGGTLSAGNVIIGATSGSRGTLTIAGGISQLSATLTAGNTVNATGIVWMTGGQLFLPTNLVIIGRSGVGQMTVSNGTVTASNTLVVAFSPASHGLLNISGGTLHLLGGLLVSDDLNAIGQVFMTDGQLEVTNGLIRLGDFNTGVGELTVSNGTLLGRDMIIGGRTGIGSQGTFNVAGGTNMLSSTLAVGPLSNSFGTVELSAGLLSVYSNLTIGTSLCVGVGEGEVSLSGGSLFVTNATGSAVLEVRKLSSLTLNSGTLTVDQLVLTNACGGTMYFPAGTLHTKSTIVSNGSGVLIGGTSAAHIHLVGGLHTFNNGLQIYNNATLSGCGTVSGTVYVYPGGTVVADCGGTLTFTGSVTIDGTMRASNGSVLESFGSVVNNGLIDVINGNTNFHGTFINHGIVLDANSDFDGDGLSNLQESLAGTDPTNSASAFRITSISQIGTNVLVTWTMGIGKTNALQRTTGVAGSFATNSFSSIFIVTNTVGTVTNYLDVGAATNKPALYYRVRLVP